MHNNTKYQCTNDRKNDKVLSMKNVRYKSRKPSMLYTSSIAYHMPISVNANMSSSLMRHTNSAQSGITESKIGMSFLWLVNYTVRYTLIEKNNVPNFLTFKKPSLYHFHVPGRLTTRVERPFSHFSNGGLILYTGEADLATAITRQEALLLQRNRATRYVS